MRYKIRGNIIKSENAAKPASQPSAFLISLLRSFAHVERSVDFGSGKLRYTKVMLRGTNTLTLVDSDIQLSREQKLGGRITSVRKLIHSSNQIEVMNLKKFLQYSNYFDRGYCINVLSVIPILSVRQRVIQRLFRSLRAGGVCLFVVQYRNSDFTRMVQMRNARVWRKGLLIDSLRGHSYYGFIMPNELRQAVVSGGFLVSSLVLNEGSVYLTAKKPSWLWFILQLAV